SVTVMPRSAARNAAAYPPGPAPITAIFKFDVSDMKAFNHEGHKGTRRKTFYIETSFVSLRVFCGSRFWFSSLNRQQERLFKRFGNPTEEPRRIRAIDQAMVVGQRQWQNQARLEFSVDPFRFHSRTGKTEDRHLGEIGN